MFLKGMAQGIEPVPWAKPTMYKTNADIMHTWRIFTEVMALLLKIISPRPVAAKSMMRLEVNKIFLRPYFSTRNTVNVVTINYLTNRRVLVTAASVAILYYHSARLLVTRSPTTSIVRTSRAWRSIPRRCNVRSSWTRGRSWNHRRQTEPSRRKHISADFFYRTCHHQRTGKCLSSTRVWPENYITILYIGTYIPNIIMMWVVSCV